MPPIYRFSFSSLSPRSIVRNRGKADEQVVHRGVECRKRHPANLWYEHASDHQKIQFEIECAEAMEQLITGKSILDQDAEDEAVGAVDSDDEDDEVTHIKSSAAAAIVAQSSDSVEQVACTSAALATLVASKSMPLAAATTAKSSALVKDDISMSEEVKCQAPPYQKATADNYSFKCEGENEFGVPRHPPSYFVRKQAYEEHLANNCASMIAKHVHMCDSVGLCPASCDSFEKATHDAEPDEHDFHALYDRVDKQERPKVGDTMNAFIDLFAAFITEGSLVFRQSVTGELQAYAVKIAQRLAHGRTIIERALFVLGYSDDVSLKNKQTDRYFDYDEKNIAYCIYDRHLAEFLHHYYNLPENNIDVIDDSDDLSDESTMLVSDDVRDLVDEMESAINHLDASGGGVGLMMRKRRNYVGTKRLTALNNAHENWVMRLSAEQSRRLVLVMLKFDGTNQSYNPLRRATHALVSSSVDESDDFQRLVMLAEWTATIRLKPSSRAGSVNRRWAEANQSQELLTVVRQRDCYQISVMTHARSYPCLGSERKDRKRQEGTNKLINPLVQVKEENVGAWCVQLPKSHDGPHVIYTRDTTNVHDDEDESLMAVMKSGVWTHNSERDQGFGKIRYMNYAGAKRKFDVARLVQRYAKYGSVPDSVEWRANKLKAKQLDAKLDSKAVNQAQQRNSAKQ